MAGATSIRRFHDTHRPPEPGGWHYWFDPQTKLFSISGNSAEEIFSQLESYRRNNRLPAVAEDIWRELWKHWCAIQPERCGDKPPEPVSPEQLPGKEVWGPIIWRFLNWSAVNYHHEFFHALVEQMRSGLVICPHCRAHFEELLIQYPAEQVKDARSACRWAYRVHAAVNRSAGKREYTYAQAVTEYGFPNE